MNASVSSARFVAAATAVRLATPNVIPAIPPAVRRRSARRERCRFETDMLAPIRAKRSTAGAYCKVPAWLSTRFTASIFDLPVAARQTRLGAFRSRG